MGLLDDVLVLTVFAATAAVVAYWLAPSEEEAVLRLRVRDIRLVTQGQKPVAEDVDLSRPLVERLFGPTLERLHRALERRTPQGTVAAARARLREAGDPMDLGTFLALRLLAAAAGFVVVGALLLPAAGVRGGNWMGALAMGVGAAYAGSAVPGFWLGRVVARRKEEIQRTLPEVLDLLCIAVEAGLGLDGAILRVAERHTSPFAQELGHCVKEINLGQPREKSWRNLAERVNVPDVNVIVAAIIQAEKLGASLGQVLRIQADEMRERRRQRAEERARQVPIKLLFPLVIFIFPALFVVLLGPAAIQFFHAMMR